MTRWHKPPIELARELSEARAMLGESSAAIVLLYRACQQALPIVREARDSVVDGERIDTAIDALHRALGAALPAEPAEPPDDTSREQRALDLDPFAPSVLR